MAKYRLEYGYDTDYKWREKDFDSPSDEAAIKEAESLYRSLKGSYHVTLRKVIAVEETKYLWGKVIRILYNE